MPFERLLRGIIKFFDLPMSSISKGDAGNTLLPIKSSYISANICYEVVYPDFIARNSSCKSNSYLSNDAWFGASIGPKQHMQMAQMRAIENSKPVIRVTNNGITGVIDHKGFVKTLPQFVESELELSITGRSGETFYNRVRSSLVLFLVVMTCIILITRKIFKEYQMKLIQAILVMLLFSVSSHLMSLDIGDKAPGFTLQATDGKTYSLDQFLNKEAVVIARYPKAFTSGCTIECKSLASMDTY